MATDKRIVIEIVDSGGVTADKDTPKAEPAKDNKIQATSSDAWGVATYAVSQAVQLAVDNAQYTYGKYLQLSENYVAQNSVTAATSTINGFTSIVTSAAGGAAVGGAIGAAIGAAFGVAKLGVQVFQNYANAYEELDQKAYDKYYYGARYGLINGNRGTDN